MRREGPETRRGQALVEMALILPVLLMLAMGTLDVGRVFGGYLSLANAAREGAVYASLHANDPNLTADVTSTINTEMHGAVPGTLTVTVNLPQGWNAGSQVTVTISASYPLLSGSVLGWKSLPLKARASMMVTCSPNPPAQCSP